ncbi:MAG: hypothetical protein JWO22_769 [Frankiales bacterium]|nr:hypothetical protein [Frankiales bacterium]
MSLADLTLARLRAEHETLAALVPTLSDEQLAATSNATEWSVAQVLSHLGSGAEIAHEGLASALAGDEGPGQEFNESVWDRWNALGDREKADQFVTTSVAFLDALEQVPDRDTATVKLAFLPMPLPFAAVVGMRLNEFALHSWDITGGQLSAETADVLAEHLGGGLSFMLGFTGKAEHVSEPVVLLAGGLVLTIDEAVSPTPDATPTATLEAPTEAALRLLSGRLREDAPVTGNITLAQLRSVFPGY